MTLSRMILSIWAFFPLFFARFASLRDAPSVLPLKNIRAIVVQMKSRIM